MLIAFLGASRPAQAAIFKKGSFTKSTGGAPVSQTIAHGLGETPKAIILWTNGQTNETFSAGYRFAWGVTDGISGTGTSRCAATSSENGNAVSNTTRIISGKALTIVEWGNVLLAEADLTSWDATNITINWTTNNSTGYVIHFIAVGGSGVSAKVVGWTMPGATGNFSVTGVGFQPTAVLHSHVGNGYLAALGTIRTHGGFSLGAMTSGGGQWANFHYALDNLADTDTQRGQQTDACIYSMNESLVVQKKASFVSMDADGFTLNFTTANSNATQTFSLALAGVSAKAGSFNKSTSAAPASQQVTGVGFAPELVLLTSFQDVTQASPVAHARFGLGASDRASEGCAATQDADVAATADGEGIDKTSKVFVKANNAAQTVDAEADMTSFESDGFTLNWTTNDAVATEMLYLALEDAPVNAVKMASFTATRKTDRVTLAWRTGHEVDNLGFHVYRELGGRRIRLTPSLIAGSALLVGRGASFAGGASYAWDDIAPGSDAAAARYWLEDVDVDGSRTWHGPVAPAAVDAADRPTAAAAGPVTLLSRLGHGDDGPAPGGSQASRDARPWTALPGDLNAQWRLAAASHAIKIVVRKEGWYRIGQPELAAAGMATSSVDPRSLQVFVDGREIPIVVAGQDDGRFDPQDGVELYGTGTDDPWTNASVYWLIAGEAVGKRVSMGVAPSPIRPAGAAAVATGFAYQAELRPRTTYFAALDNGERDNFFGPLVGREPLAQVFDLHHMVVPAGGRAHLEVAVQGVTEQPHRIAVTMGGAPVGELAFSGRTWKRGVFAVDYALLTDPRPRVALAGADPSDQISPGKDDPVRGPAVATTVTLQGRDSETDVSLVDYIRLTYQHAYTADAGQLRFTVPSGRVATIGGFREASVRVLDVTDPHAVFELRADVEPRGEESIARVVTPPDAGERTLLAVASSRAVAPDAIEANRPSRWHQESEGADLVLLGPAPFLDRLGALRAARERQNLTVTAIAVDDVYDELAFGRKTPWALRAFLERAARTWRRPPRFVLLVGDASFDPRGYLASGQADWVPTKIVGTDALETASDGWFSDFDGDGVPDLAIGRLPVNTPDQAEALAMRIAATPSRAPDDAGHAVLVADRNDSFDFEAASATLVASLPPSLAVTHLLRGRWADGDAGNQLRDALNAGPTVVSYLGHGSLEQWAGPLLTTSSAAALSNGSRLPLVVSMTCLSGFFHDARGASLAEALITAAGGGAAAVWASSGMTPPDDQGAVGRELLRRVFLEGQSLGEAAAGAAASSAHRDVRRTWNLLGDPSWSMQRLPLATVAVPAPALPPKHPSAGCSIARSDDPRSPEGSLAAIAGVGGLALLLRVAARRQKRGVLP